MLSGDLFWPQKVLIGCLLEKACEVELRGTLRLGVAVHDGRYGCRDKARAGAGFQDGNFQERRD